MGFPCHEAVAFFHVRYTEFWRFEMLRFGVCLFIDLRLLQSKDEEKSE